jgi:hypothetical protein
LFAVVVLFVPVEELLLLSAPVPVVALLPVPVPVPVVALLPVPVPVPVVALLPVPFVPLLSIVELPPPEDVVPLADVPLLLVVVCANAGMAAGPTLSAVASMPMLASCAILISFIQPPVQNFHFGIPIVRERNHVCEVSVQAAT